ncbi:MAG: DNA recombination protein RmuC [Fimbriimonadaceae bacterium]
MTIKLPGGRCLVIDSKAPMRQYLSGLRMKTKRIAGFFCRSCKETGRHAKVLGKRDYAKIDSAPDFTIMFVPSESAFRVALENRPGLLEDAMAVNVDCYAFDIAGFASRGQLRLAAGEAGGRSEADSEVRL